VVVAEITSLAHVERVGESLLVLAFGGLDVAAEPTVAIRAQVLRVVPPVRMLAFSDSHRLLFFGRGRWYGSYRKNWRFRARYLVLFDGSVFNRGSFFNGLFSFLFGGG
jgi:hypothetical protein